MKSEVLECLEIGAEINSKYLNNTALTLALMRHQNDLADLLISRADIDINQPNYREETPLIIAISENNGSIASKLINEPRCDLKYMSPLYGTALTAAIFFEKYKIAQEIIEKIPNFNPNEHPAALNLAIRQKQSDLIKILISKGATIDSFGNENYFDELPDWLWQEVKVGGSPFYPDRREPIFDLPILHALKTANKSIIEIFSTQADIKKKGVHGLDALELANRLKLGDPNGEIANIILEEPKAKLINKH